MVSDGWHNITVYNEDAKFIGRRFGYKKLENRYDNRFSYKNTTGLQVHVKRISENRSSRLAVEENHRSGKIRIKPRTLWRKEIKNAVSEKT